MSLRSVRYSRLSGSVRSSVSLHSSSFFHLTLVNHCPLSHSPFSIKLIVAMFNFRKKRPDFIYEKVSRSSSEDGSTSEEAQGFLTPDRQQLVLPKSSKFTILAIVSFVFSGLLNISLLSFISYQYAHRGPSSPVFPELVYCKPYTSQSLFI
jgi:hypothetical protein